MLIASQRRNAGFRAVERRCRRKFFGPDPAREVRSEFPARNIAREREGTMEIKAKPKSFHYQVGVRWSREKRGVLVAGGKPDLEVASPPEFRGHPGIWSPEDLLVAAVNACTMTTFLSAMQRREIGLVSYESDAIGTLELADGEFRFTRVVLRPRIVVRRPEDCAAALAAVREAETGCLIAHSIVAKVEVEPVIAVQALEPSVVH
jgi:organic hydroperoxide reductase OsmC/OhrA